MTKLIIFDLDGVLVEAKQIHYDTLNQALREVDEKYVITEAEHLSTYDGLKTTQKLEMLTKNKGLHPEFYDDIWYRKQHLTIEAISELQPDIRLIEIFNAGSIPVIISDNYPLPFNNVINWNEICIVIKENNINNINEILLEKSHNSIQLQEMQNKIYMNLQVVNP